MSNDVIHRLMFIGMHFLNYISYTIYPLINNKLTFGTLFIRFFLQKLFTQIFGFVPSHNWGEGGESQVIKILNTTNIKRNKGYEINIWYLYFHLYLIYYPKKCVCGGEKNSGNAKIVGAASKKNNCAWRALCLTEI